MTLWEFLGSVDRNNYFTQKQKSNNNNKTLQNLTINQLNLSSKTVFILKLHIMKMKNYEYDVYVSTKKYKVDCRKMALPYYNFLHDRL